MHHIKNILNSNIFFKKNIRTNKLLGPSLSIIKPELTAIFSILNRIFGVILIIILTLFPFFLLFFKNSHPYAMSTLFFIIILLCIIIYHLIYGRLKLLLYINDIFLFINSNIKLINNIYIIFSIFGIMLIFLDLYIINYFFLIKLDFSLSDYSFYFNCGIFFFILFYLKFKLNKIIYSSLTYDIKNYILINYYDYKTHFDAMLEEDYKEILPLILEIKEWRNDFRHITCKITDEWRRIIRYLTQ